MKINCRCNLIGMFERISIILFIIMVTESSAHAYIDPGTGSVVLQLIAAIAFAALITIKQWGRYIVNLFKRKPKVDDDAQE